MLTITRIKVTVPLLLAAFALNITTSAANITKDMYVWPTDLSAGEWAWVGNVPPASGDVATWDANSWCTGLSLETNASWLGLNINLAVDNIDVADGITTGPTTLTLGTSGIDMSTATKNLTWYPAIAIGAAQTWNLASSRTLYLNGALSGSAALTKSGAGTVYIGGSAENFTGSLEIAAGNVVITNSTTNGFSAVNFTGSTAQLRIKSNSYALGNAPVGLSAATRLVTETGSSAITLSNNITYNAALAFTVDPAAAPMTLAGNITAADALAANIQLVGIGRTIIDGTVTLRNGSVLAGNTKQARVQFNSNANVTLNKLDSAATTDDGTGTNFQFHVVGGSLALKQINLGSGGNTTGRMVQEGGTVTLSGNANALRIATSANTGRQSSRYLLTGGTLDASASGVSCNIGEVGPGTMLVGGGAGVATFKAYRIVVDAGTDDTATMALTNAVNGVIEIGAGGTASASTTDLIVLSGGTMKAVTNAAWDAPMTLDAATTSTLDSGAYTVTGSNVVSGSGSIVKVGSGTLSLNNVANSITGSTTVSNGTLQVNGTVGAVTVVSTGALGACSSTNTLTVSGAAVVNGKLLARINQTNAAKVVFGSTANITGATLTVTNVGSLVNGTTYDLFDGTPTGTFTTLNLPGGLSHWNTSSLYSAGTITLVNNAPVAQDFSINAAQGVPTAANVIPTHVTDADSGDVLTITAVGAATNGTVAIVGGTNVTYTSTNAATSDSFTYTVSDGLVSVSKTVTVTFGMPEGYNTVGIAKVGSNAVLNYLGSAGLNYALEWTHSLTPTVTWVPIVTNTAAGNGTVAYTNTPSGSNDFYRVVHIP